MLVQASAVRALIAVTLVIFLLLALSHDSGVVAVGQQDDAPCRDRERGRRLRSTAHSGSAHAMPRPGRWSHWCCRWAHLVDLAVELRPVVGQRHAISRAAAIVDWETASSCPRARRRVLRVIGIGAIPHAAFPVVLPVVLLQPLPTCQPLQSMRRCRTTVVLVGGPEIDSGVERNDGHLDVAGVLGRLFQRVQQVWRPS